MKGKKILIAQPSPQNGSPYSDLETKFGLQFEFTPFFRVEPVSSRDFRAQKVSILDHTAIVFSSKSAIDAFFRICEDNRVAVPETMKYFCQSEQIALYLQKYIVYRKRKIFFGDGKPLSIVNSISARHHGEKFLIACTDALREDIALSFSKEGLNFSSAIFMHTVHNDISHLNLSDYGMLVFYSPADVKSLFESFPDFRQGDCIIATYGTMTAAAARDAGLEIGITAPTPEAPSIAQAISLFCGKGK
ncbi:MAG: uroporphyrinogen-III synthase [Bacteroidales bacterium]|nr:uroporphyrinogen-III synthase [Bacteroidales bacterium]